MKKGELLSDVQIDARVLQNRPAGIRDVDPNEYNTMQCITIGTVQADTAKEAFDTSRDDEDYEVINWQQLTGEASQALERTCISIITMADNNWLVPFLEALIDPSKRKEPESPENLKISLRSKATEEKKLAQQEGFIDANLYIQRRALWTSARTILRSWNLAELRCAWGKMVKLTEKGTSIVQKALEEVQKRTAKKKQEERRKEITTIARKAVRMVFKELKEKNQELLRQVAERLVHEIEGDFDNQTPVMIQEQYSELIKNIVSELKPMADSDEPLSTEIDPFNGSLRKKDRKKS